MPLTAPRRVYRTFLRSSLSLAALIFIVSAASSSTTPIIHSIGITGNHFFSERTLLDAIVSKPQAQFSITQLKSDMRSILDRYQDNGFYFADVSLGQISWADDSMSVDVAIQIDEGKQLRIGEILIEGNSAFTKDQILRAFDTNIENSLVPQRLEQDIDGLLGRYEQSGYPFANVAVSQVSLRRDNTDTSLAILLSIDEGQRVTINQIRVLGNSETNEQVIFRETGIALGETYRHDKVMGIQRRLNRLNIFATVGEPELFVNTAGGGLTITVQEGNTNTFDGILGYIPSSRTGEKGYLTGLVNVMMRNLFGTARKLNVRWQREDQNSQDLALRYVEPWVFNLPVDLTLGFQQRQQDTTYVRRVVEAKGDVRITESFTLGGMLTYETVIPSATLAVQSLFNSRTMTTGLEIHYDSRDDRFSPTSGVNYRSDYQIGMKKFTAPTSPGQSTEQRVTVQRVGLDAEFFVQPFFRQVIAVGLHGRQLTSDNIELGDLYRFGGASTLRGYRENQFLGSRIAWTNTEYRFLIARRSFFYGFFDSGYYFLPGDDVKGISATQRIKYGYGIGIRLETSLGNIGVGFALGEGDSFGQAKVHVGLVNEF